MSSNAAYLGRLEGSKPPLLLMLSDRCCTLSRDLFKSVCSAGVLFCGMSSVRTLKPASNSLSCFSDSCELWVGFDLLDLAIAPGARREPRASQGFAV